MGFSDEFEQLIAERKAYKAPSLAETYAINQKWPRGYNPDVRNATKQQTKYHNELQKRVMGVFNDEAPRSTMATKYEYDAVKYGFGMPGIPSKPKTQEKKPMFGISYVKEYLNRHRDTVMTLFAVLFIDHFFLKGALRARIQRSLNKLLDGVESKLGSDVEPPCVKQ